MREEKDFLFQEDIIEEKVPLWPEISIEKVLAMVDKDKNLLKFFPDFKRPAHQLNRQFLWGILLTIRNDWAHDLIKLAYK